MFCVNCGKQSSSGANFCQGCGQPLLENVSNPSITNQNRPKNKSNTLAIVLAITIPLTLITIFGVFVFFLFVVVEGVTSELQMMSTVDLGNEVVPTLKDVLGEKEICSYSATTGTSVYGSTYYGEYEYCDSTLTKEEYDKYFDYLIEEEDFTEGDGRFYRMVTREATDKGMIVEIEINLDTDTIFYMKKVGTIDDGRIDEPTNMWEMIF